MLAVRDDTTRRRKMTKHRLGRLGTHPALLIDQHVGARSWVFSEWAFFKDPTAQAAVGRRAGCETTVLSLSRSIQSERRPFCSGKEREETKTKKKKKIDPVRTRAQSKQQTQFPLIGLSLESTCPLRDQRTIFCMCVVDRETVDPCSFLEFGEP